MYNDAIQHRDLALNLTMKILVCSRSLIVGFALELKFTVRVFGFEICCSHRRIHCIKNRNLNAFEPRLVGRNHRLADQYQWFGPWYIYQFYQNDGHFYQFL